MNTLEEQDLRIHILEHRDAIDLAQEAETLLSAAEQERAARYRNPADRIRFVARRAFLRQLLAQYLSCGPDEIQFRTSCFGRPFLQGGITFSVTQTDSLALLAFARGCRIGVDAEVIRPAADLIATGREVFSDVEMRTLVAAPEMERQFYKTWTRKEALVKAFGSGLSGEAKRFTTEDAGDSQWRAWRRNGRPLAGWTLRDLAIHPGVAASVAASSPRIILL